MPSKTSAIKLFLLLVRTKFKERRGSVSAKKNAKTGALFFFQPWPKNKLANNALGDGDFFDALSTAKDELR